jgi:hypothetical protein
VEGFRASSSASEVSWRFTVPFLIVWRGTRDLSDAKRINGKQNREIQTEPYVYAGD